MLWFINLILFLKKNVYGEWETKGKLTHSQIITIRYEKLRAS